MIIRGILATWVQNLRPGHRRQTFQDIVGKLLRGEITVFQECARFDLDIADRPKIFNKRSEGMERTDRLDSSY